MEAFDIVLPQVSSSDWACSLDLRDAYLHVPVHPDSQRLLGFQFGETVLEYRCLPFGLESSPWLFSRVVQEAISFIRRQGIRIFLYLDGWLLLAGSPELLRPLTSQVLSLSADLGLLIDLEISRLEPSRFPVFLGASIGIPTRVAGPTSHRSRRSGTWLLAFEITRWPRLICGWYACVI